MEKKRNELDLKKLLNFSGGKFSGGGVESFLQSYISNPNLLPNWYFADPANQRGLTEYVGENHIYEMYSFDQIQVYNGVSCELVSNGLKFSFPGYESNKREGDSLPVGTGRPANLGA